METYRVCFVFAALASAALAATLAKESDKEAERVVLVAPVLAPPRDARTHVTDRARQFPVLVLLAQKNPAPKSLEPEAKELGVGQPIYVQKLEDQEKPEPALTDANREKRHLKKWLHFSHGGGGGGGGYQGVYQGGYQGGYQTYQEPTKTIIVKVIKEERHHGGGNYGHGGGNYGHGGGNYGHGGGNYEHGGGNYGHGGGNYGGEGCGGGCGGDNGGYSNSGSHATATATASASAQSYASGYGKR